MLSRLSIDPALKSERSIIVSAKVLISQVFFAERGSKLRVVGRNEIVRGFGAARLREVLAQRACERLWLGA